MLSQTEQIDFIILGWVVGEVCWAQSPILGRMEGGGGEKAESKLQKFENTHTKRNPAGVSLFVSNNISLHNFPRIELRTNHENTTNELYEPCDVIACEGGGESRPPPGSPPIC